MQSSCEEAVTGGNVDDTGTSTVDNDPNDEEYVQAIATDDEDHVTSNDEDDGYENDDQNKNEYLQLKADHEDGKCNELLQSCQDRYIFT